MSLDTDRTRRLRADLEARVAERDRAGAVELILTAVADGLEIETLYDDVLAPFLAEIGSDWQSGRRAVWEEHLATQIVRTAVEALYPVVVERKRQAPALDITAAFFCPEEETHDLGLRMLADRFDLEGYDTLFVGAATPTRDMVAASRAAGASVVCLSASSHYNRALLLHAVRALEQELPSVRIVVGGPAFPGADTEWQPYLVPDLDSLFAELGTGRAGGDRPRGGSGAGSGGGRGNDPSESLHRDPAEG